jgi:hypothetical protein
MSLLELGQDQEFAQQKEELPRDEKGQHQFIYIVCEPKYCQERFMLYM